MNYRAPHFSHADRTRLSCSSRDRRALHPGHTQGFTLLELLIAVAVFAVVAVTVYTRSGETLVQLQMLEQRTLASWIAQNELALARIRQVDNPEAISIGSNSRTVLMGGRDWTVTVDVKGTSHAWLRRVEVEVMPADQRDAGAHTMVGFIGRY
jgi:general secretion pathway protein I